MNQAINSYVNIYKSFLLSQDILSLLEAYQVLSLRQTRLLILVFSHFFESFIIQARGMSLLRKSSKNK